MTSTTDLKSVMLVLAGLTYRGFYFWRVLEDRHERAVRRAVADGLRVVEPVIGKWELVWGPATKSRRGEFDESAMYVAQSAADPRRVVIAIRGTNPIELADWTRGDFNVATPVPWPFGDGTATVSGSTASGLTTLLRLTEPPPSRVGDAVEKAVYGLGQFVPDSLVTFLRPCNHERGYVFETLSSRLRDLFGRFEPVMQKATKVVADGVVRKLLELGATPTKVTTWPAVSPTGSGATLLDFLIRRARDGPADVLVTGHSKGGALAPALGLWLAETRSRWDPKGNVRIGCYAFAGPTPGNGAFGNRVKDELDGDNCRVINTSDVVTHAWDDAGLASIAELYDGSLAWLQPILSAVREKVVRDRYQALSLPTDQFDGVAIQLLPIDSRDAAMQIPYQHLEAYLARFGLLATTPRIDTLTLYGLQRSRESQTS
jgi:hypothetical protein